jgi:hypothetical protein
MCDGVNYTYIVATAPRYQEDFALAMLQRKAVNEASHHF